MHYLRHIFHILAVIAVLFASCSPKDKVIPKKDMERVIGEIYLADQYIERHPELRAQTDSLILYEGVMQRHGYTLDDYTNSVEYYLQKGDALKKIYLNARKQILKRKDELDKLVSQQNKRKVRWWASDSVARKEINSLWKEPYLRTMKWMANFKAREEWRFTDTTIFDTPQNGLWWKNTILLNSESSPADSLYPILQRQYLIWREKNARIGNNAKKGSGIYRPDNKKYIMPDIKKHHKQTEAEFKAVQITEMKRAEADRRRKSRK